MGNGTMTLVPFFPSLLPSFPLQRCEAACWSPLLLALWVPLWRGAGTLAPSECCPLPSTRALVYKEGPWRKLSLLVAVKGSWGGRPHVCESGVWNCGPLS